MILCFVGKGSGDPLSTSLGPEIRTNNTTPFPRKQSQFIFLERSEGCICKCTCLLQMKLKMGSIRTNRFTETHNTIKKKSCGSGTPIIGVNIAPTNSILEHK